MNGNRFVLLVLFDSNWFSGIEDKEEWQGRKGIFRGGMFFYMVFYECVIINFIVIQYVKHIERG